MAETILELLDVAKRYETGGPDATLAGRACRGSTAGDSTWRAVVVVRSAAPRSADMQASFAAERLSKPGGCGWIRTTDTGLMSPLLYP